MTAPAPTKLPIHVKLHGEMRRVEVSFVDRSFGNGVVHDTYEAYEESKVIVYRYTHPAT